MDPQEVELVRSAQAGDVSALGTLLARHQAGMRAVALSVLGFGPDAEDAVQDAALTAVRRIGTLRDPAAAGPWLRAVVRNACRLRLRAARRVVPVADPRPPADPATPERILEDHVSRDWIGHAIDRLSPALRQVVLLRHFSDVTSYDQIAAACELPVGTVRSRLNQARAKLSEALLATADEAYDDTAARNAASAREATDTLTAARRGAFATVVADRWSPAMRMTSGQGYRGGVDLAVRGMDLDLAHGVRQKLVHAVTSRDCTVWEMEMISPPDDPHHCPPALVWLMSHREGRVDRLRLFFPAVSAGRTAGASAG
ncbi:RNA polymerase sigma factor [Amycolatopsis rifamycinica]|uniref:RNA polymerase sigma factor n=1 Tax=Amycolatopsis rifamycinica TaxID=287986 RepID=UPI000A9A4172|nr:sigma-70 family RNA polymerase sigma factor [Amycolatopsis rifamycinica]